MDADPHSNVGFIVKDGVVHRVRLKYRKSEAVKPVKKRKKRVQLEVTDENIIKLCPEASPPLSPQEQRRRGHQRRGNIQTHYIDDQLLAEYHHVETAGVRSTLFQVMIKRIPKLIVPVDHSVWAMQELADTNTKCMRLAAVGHPEPRYSLIIRAPVPWHQQFLIAREFATHNLFATHPVSLELRKLWNSKYRTSKLFDRLWDRISPLDPDALLHIIRRRCDHLKSTLTDQWIPECCQVLTQLKPTWSAMVPLKRGESLQQVLRFFNSISRLIALQIRELLYTWIDEWLSAMAVYDSSGSSPTNGRGNVPKEYHQVQPFIRLELAANNGKIFVKPKREMILWLMERILQNIVNISFRIPRIERIFLPGYSGGEEFLVPITWEEDYIQSVMAKVKVIVNSNDKAPGIYIRETYTAFESILQQSFSDSFEESGEVPWEENEKLFMERMKELNDIKSNLLELKTHVYLKLYYLDCRSINKHLIQFIESIKAKLVTRILKDHRKIVRSICSRFEAVTEKVSHVPESTTALVESVEYVRCSLSERLPAMIVDVKEAGKRLLTLLGYTILHKDDLALSCRLFHWPKDLESVLQVSSTRLQRIRAETERDLKERTGKFLEQLEECGQALEIFKSKEATSLTTEEMKTSTATLQDLHQKLQAASDELEDINFNERLLEWPVTQAPILPYLVEMIDPYYQLWHVAYKFHISHDEWFHGPFRKLDSQAIAAEINSMHRQMTQLGIVFADVNGAKRVADTVRKRIEKFMSFLPLLHAVCNPGLRERHWVLISKNFESPMCPEPETSLAELVSAGLMQYIVHIEEVSLTATKEFALEETLQRMQSEWNEVSFEFLPYRDSDVCVLTGIEEIQALVDDHILRSQTMHASAYIAPLEPLLQSWEEQLVGIQDTMDVWMKVQNTWLYLEPIFSSEDIQRQMPADAAKFTQVDVMWRSLMSGATTEPRVLQATSRSGLLDELRSAFAILEDIQKGLHDYLEKKRVFFSRFYFLSNDELLEILSKTKEPERIQPHLRKCFDGIGRLQFNANQEIEAMISEGSERDREIVQFREPINPARSKGMVELWMSEVDDAMKDALIHYTFTAMSEWSGRPEMDYLQRYPGQSIFCAAAIRWTESVTNSILDENQWTELESSITSTISHLTSLISKRPSPTVRITLNNLIMFYLHGRDIVQRLKSKYVSSIDDFEWLKNLRYYWNTDALEGLGHLTVAMVETQIPYGFEYMGNSHRLVLTPTTEKGFQIIMLALKQYQGGWLHGLQGVGKTETIKELARAVAKQCLVFNCFHGLDTKSIGRILKGIAQSGAWSCFDDIDHVAPDVVSVMAVQIQILQMALSRRLRRVNFEGSDVQVTAGAAVFITTRTKDVLPDSFRSLFRLAVMLPPDLHYIIKISLLSQGFQNHKAIGPRIYKLIHDISAQIPDVSTNVNLRSLREILKISSRLKAELNNLDETTIIHQAFKLFYEPQLTPSQGCVLRGLIDTSFPASTMAAQLGSDLFNQSVTEACHDFNLIPSQRFIDKVWQLHESLTARNGVILLGETLTGKSTLYKILAKVYPKIMGSSASDDGRVLMHVISPWSLPSKYLYEWYQEEKSRWNDGVITKALRELSANSPTSPRWLILDGHVHSELVGHLHTLLDASRKLTLPSGEVLQIPLSFRIIFETSDLTYASPSTITRCGVIRVADDIVTVDSLYQSWLKKSNFPTDISPYFDTFIQVILKPTLDFSNQSSASCFIATASSLLFASFTRLVNSLIATNENLQLKPLSIMKILAFAVIWTVGATFKPECKQDFSQFFVELFQKKHENCSVDMKTVLPALSESTVFAYKLDIVSGQWSRWKDNLPSISASFVGPRIIVSSEAVAIEQFFIKVYSNTNVPVLVLGPASCGKSQVTQYAIEDLPKDRFVHNFVHVTAVTTSSSLLNSVMIGLDRRRKGVYGPALGRRCVLFVDDLIACDPVEGSIRTPLELLRHWLNYECVFDAKTASKMELVDIHLVTSVRLDEQFNEEFDIRLLRHMNIIFVNSLKREDLVEMSTKTMERHFTKSFVNSVVKLAPVVALATIDLYEVWQEKKSEEIPHYSVSVSCVNRVLQGLMAVSSACLTNAAKLHRLWIHEACRVWADRLMTEDDRKWFIRHLDRIGFHHFKQSLDKYLFASTMGGADYRILPKIHFSFLQNASTAEATCDEVTDMDAMIQMIENRLEKHNKETNFAPVKLVISLNVANHVLHISHALSRQRGHVILIGDAGRGRRSCATLAALMLNYDIFQIKAGRNYGVHEWKEDVKKLIHRSGIQQEKIVLLCNAADFQRRIFFDYIGRLISGFEISELFTNEERMEMVEVYQKRTKEIAKFSQILRHVDDNLRVALCISPSDSSYRHLPQYHTVFKFASILWFEPWPEETLEVIAKKWLDDIPGLNDKLQLNYSNYFKNVHNSMRVYSESKGMIQHSSAAYLELLATFRTLWLKKEKDLLQQKQRYNVGLGKLQFAASQVVVMQEELRSLQPQLVDTSAETESLMVKIEQDTVEVEAQKEIIAADESLANEAAAAAQAIKDECESDLAEATPALEAAITALDTLKPADITLVKSMRHPPSIVKLVMEAVCVMKQIPPVKKLEPGSGKATDNYWQASQKLLGDLRFLDVLRSYDKDNIPPHVMKRIREKYIPNPEFNPNIVRHVSTACEGLCRWVRAMEVYDRVIKIVSPKRAKLQEAEQELARQMKRLSEKHTQLQQISDKLQGLNDDFAAMSKKKKDLEDSIDQCRQKMERAEKLIGGLGGEQENWKTSSNNLDFRLKQLPGDILLSASIITYLGSVKNEHRAECLENWLKLIQQCEIPHSTTFSLVDCLIDQVKIRAWNLAGLPSDNYSLDNGIIATHCQRWPLLFDPQDQGLKWIVEMENKNTVHEIRYDDVNYLKELKKSISEGHVAVLVNVIDKLDPEIDHLLEKRIFTHNQKTVVQIGSELVDWSPKFSLYLITKEENSSSNLELASKLTIVNFRLSRPGLEDKFLSLFLSSERPELEEQKQMLMYQSASNQRQIRDLEDRILYVLSASRGNILEDETATRTLYSSKVTSEGISVKQKEIQKSEQEIDQVRESYRAVSSHAAALYSCIGQLKHLNKVYQFSLPWFVNLFKDSIAASQVSILINERIIYVNEHFTRTLHHSICRALFNCDRQLFTVLLAFAALRSKSNVQQETIDRLYTEAPLPSTHWLGPSWIDDLRWQHIIELSQAVTNMKDLPDHMEKNPDIWKEFCHLSNVTGSLPTPWNKLEPLEQLLIIKHLKPDCFTASISSFVQAILGSNYSENMTTDVVGAYDESRPKVPILCFVSGSGDPLQNIASLCELKLENRNRVKSFFLGRGMDKTVYNFIRRCVDEGNWAVIQNIHLYANVVDGILDQLRMDQREFGPEFRLWMIGHASSDYSPATLQYCVKTVCEPPIFFRDCLLEILRLDFVHGFSGARATSAESTFQSSNPSLVEKENMLFRSEPWRRVSFALFCFHALLLDRNRYSSLGFAGTVEFTYHDLKSALILLKDAMLTAKDISLTSLRSLVVDCVYRVQLTHDKDAQILRRLIDLLLSTEILQSDKLVVSLCGKISIPFTSSIRAMIEVVQVLPKDLGPEAVGLSRELIKQCHVNESIELLRKLNCCSGSFDH